MTRDHAVWLWGRVVGLAGLVVSGAIDPAAFGLSDTQRHAVMAVCALVAYLSGQMSTSPLPGKARP